MTVRTTHRSVHARILMTASMVSVLVASSAIPEARAQTPAGIAELYLTGEVARLRETANEEDASGTVAGRRPLIDNVHRQLMLPSPPDALVPELYDLLTAMLPRMQAGALRPAWASYVYTSYHQDLRRARATGEPRASIGDIERKLDQYAKGYKLLPRLPPHAPKDADPAPAD